MNRFIIFCVVLSLVIPMGWELSFGEDWPVYLHDNARSGVTSESLTLPLQENWVFKSTHEPQPAWPSPAERDYWHRIRELRPLITFDRTYHVVAAAGSVFFGSSADDKVYALDAATGRKRWTYFTEGPVRLAPTYYDGKIYAASDDGSVYCLDADEGTLVWKYRAVLQDRRLPGNGRMISLWPNRTGIIADDGKVYFFTGIFPTQGVYLCALDARDGSVLLKKEVDNVAAQGYLLASKTRLYVPTGRTAPAVFDRKNGDYLGVLQSQGGAYALLSEEMLYNGPGRTTGEVSLADVRSKEKIAGFDGVRIIVKGGKAYLLSKNSLAALDRKRHLELATERNELDKRRVSIEKRLRNTKNAPLSDELKDIKIKIASLSEEMQRCILWKKTCTFPYSMILAGDILFTGGQDMVAAFDPADGREIWTAAVPGRAYGLAVAGGALYVSTDRGLIYCFKEGTVSRQGVVSSYIDPHPYPEDDKTSLYAETAKYIIDKTGVKKGYCLVLGSETGRLAYELARRSDLRIAGLEEDLQKVEEARRTLDRAGLYGSRIVIHHGSPADLPYVDYIANLVVSDRALVRGEIPGKREEVYRVLRPCGGIAWLGQYQGIAGSERKLSRSAIENWLESKSNPGGRIEREGGMWAVLERGSLAGSGEWTHLYADVGNTACSGDRVKGPMGIQWYGRPGPRKIVDRHHRPMSPLYKNGRLFIPANDRIITVDAYNGTPLWELSVPYSRRIGALKDSGQMVLAEDCIYIAAEDECHAVDVETGEPAFTLKAPQLSAGEKRDWGYLGVKDEQIYASCTKVGASFYELSEGTCNLLEGDFREMILGDYLFSLNRHTGDVLWTYKNGSVFNNTIVVGQGRVYFVESRNKETMDDPDGRISVDRFCKSDTYLVALDARTGDKIWEKPFHFPYQQIMYLSYAEKILLAAGSYNRGEYVHYGLHAFDAETGNLKWNDSYQGDRIGGTHGEQWQHPVIVSGKVYSRPYDYNLYTGEKGTYKLDRGGHGCGGLSGSAFYLYGRGWNPRMYALHDGKESGTPLTLVNRPGCWINIIPAGGIVLLPESSSGCSCDFPISQDCVLFLLPERIMVFNAVTKQTGVIKTAGQISLGRFIQMIAFRDRSVWISCETGLVKLFDADGLFDSQSEWIGYPAEGKLGIHNLRYPYEGNNGELFLVADSFAENKPVLVRFDGESWEIVFREDKNIIRGWRGADNSIWVEEERNLYHIWGGKKELVERKESLAGTIFDVAVEADGSFWMATSLGLVRYAPTLWRSPKISGEVDSTATSIYENPKGQLWFACRNSLVLLRDGTRERYPLPGKTEVLPYPNTAISFMADGRIAIPTLSLDSNLLVFDPAEKKFESIPHPSGRGIGYIAARTDGTLWIQTIKPTSNEDYNLDHYRLEIFDGERFHTYLDRGDTWGIDKLTCLLEAENGDLWIGGLTGLGLYQNDIYRIISPAEGYTGNGAFCMKEIEKGTIWIGGRIGILEFKEGRWTTLQPDLYNIYHIIIAHDRSIWVASGCGIHHYANGNWITNTVEDGLLNTTVLKVFQDSSGRVWAHTANGLSCYYPEADKKPPETFISPQKNLEETPPGGDVRFVFGGRDKWNQTTAERLVYSYRFNKEPWSSYQADTVVSATGLTTGPHRLEVRAVDRNRNIDSTPATFKFTVLSPWYKQSGFLFLSSGGSIVIILLLGYAFSRYFWLEKTVEMRTTELIAVNQSLQSEIAERKHTQKELSQRENLYRTLVENLKQYIFLKDPDLKFVSANSSFCDLLGTSPELLIGKTDYDFFPEDLAKKYRVDDRKVLASGESLELIEEHQTSEKLKWVEVVKTPVKDSEGNVTGVLGIFWDVTERKLVEEALRESEERFSKAFRLSPLALVISTLDSGRLIEVNDAVEEMSGYRREELIGQKIKNLGLIKPEILEKAKNILLDQGAFRNLETTFVTKSGEERIGLFSCEIIDIKGEKCLIQTVSDITDRKQAEEALREERDRAQKYLDIADVMLIVIDTVQNVTLINRKGCEILGYDEEEIIENNWFDNFIPERDRYKVKTTFSQLITGKIDPHKYYENSVLTKSGEERIIAWHNNILRDETGKILGTISSGEDITDRKRAEEALATEKERLAVTLRSIGDGVITTDTHGKIVLLNKIAERLTGWPEQEALGRSIDEVFFIFNKNTRERCLNPVEKVLKTGEIIGLANQTILIARDGTERILADSGAPIRDRDSTIIGVVLVFRDVTDKNRMEEELINARKLESIGILAGGIAHDFNNILTAIIGNISLTKSMTDPEDKRFNRLIQAEKASLRAQDLTQQLLTFSKGGNPVKTTASIVEVVKESTGFALRGSNVRADFSFPGTLWPVDIDKGQMSQVIQNLIINADQAMPEGGTINVSAENLTIGTEGIKHAPILRAGKYVHLSVEDQGVGISELHLQKIFDPYFTTKQRGSGLGLATSFSIVKKHKGTITVASELGSSTTFSIFLPASSKELEIQGITASKPLEGFGKILIMDDEDSIRDTVSKMLEHIGYQTESAKDGTEAIELYKQAKESGFPFDAVLMDLTVPGGMGGKETIQILLEYDPLVKGIVTSGYSNDPIMAEYKNHGFHNVIVKPYKIETLNAILQNIL